MLLIVMFVHKDMLQKTAQVNKEKNADNDQHFLVINCI